MVNLVFEAYTCVQQQEYSWQHTHTSTNYHLLTSKILSPGWSRPSLAAAPVGFTVVTKIPGSFPTWILSTPPLMLNPKPTYRRNIIIIITAWWTKTRQMQWKESKSELSNSDKNNYLEWSDVYSCAYPDCKAHLSGFKKVARMHQAPSAATKPDWLSLLENTDWLQAYRHAGI